MTSVMNIRSVKSNYPDIDSLVTWDSSNAASEVDIELYFQLRHLTDYINLSI
jgi:hypothetical protein